MVRGLSAWLAATLLAAGCSCAEGPDDDSPAEDAGTDDGGPDAAGDAGPDGDGGLPVGPCDEPCPGELSCCSDGAEVRCLDLAGDPGSCGACGAFCAREEPVCLGGECRPCEEIGQTTCNGACVVLDIDSFNCGECGRACGAGEQCIAGQCQGGECEGECLGIDGAGAACCFDPEGRPSCFDLRNDEHHCGGCGVWCGPAGRCDGGPGRCACDEEPGVRALCGELCVAVSDDEENCGDCGVVCPVEAPVCREGRCVECAAVGLLDCGLGECLDADTDERACGGCGVTCPAGHECFEGACVEGTCAEDYCIGIRPLCCEDSGGRPECTSLLVDARNCGACGQDCGEAGTCEDGACQCEGGADVAACDGSCVDLDSNASHCGACGNGCPPGDPRCIDATCTSCEDLGLTDCGGAACADTELDPQHCGGCDTPCSDREQCVGGACLGGECNDCAQDANVCCLNPYAEADPGCTDLTIDPWNCGGCGVWCADGERCELGVCVP